MKVRGLATAMEHAEVSVEIDFDFATSVRTTRRILRVLRRMPALPPPERSAHVNAGPSYGSRPSAESACRLITPLSLNEVVDYYHTLLKTAGWHMAEDTRSRLEVLSRWRVTSEGEDEAQGAFSAILQPWDRQYKLKVWLALVSLSQR
jgi:hypothetical protein